jgi:hypothetical protein
MTIDEAAEHYQRMTLFSSVNRLAVSFHNANPKLTAMAAIDLENDEVISFLKDLESANIKFLLVGGFAVAFHGHVRATHDLDIWIKADDETLCKLKEILIKNGSERLKTSRSFDLVPGFTQFPVGRSGFLVDPMKNLKAFSQYDFDKCYERAEGGEFKGAKFKVINKMDLLAEKEANNRAKDQGDIEYLRSLMKK